VAAHVERFVGYWPATDLAIRLLDDLVGAGE
jgi:hypothetical protein